jgi:hypothetical protein
MHARLLALACLLYVSASSGRSESITPAAADVDVYLKTGQGVSTAVLDEMKSELASLMQGTGVRFEWRVLKESRADTISGFAVVVELRGQCGVTWHADWPQLVGNATPLASSAMADGYILPFSWIDCAALNRLVGPLIADEPDALRDYIYGRALARLLAHELYHVFMQTTAHAQTGIAKAQFTAAELLAESFQYKRATFKSQMPKSQMPKSQILKSQMPQSPMPAPAESELIPDAVDDPAVGK